MDSGKEDLPSCLRTSGGMACSRAGLSGRPSRAEETQRQISAPAMADNTIRSVMESLVFAIRTTVTPQIRNAGRENANPAGKSGAWKVIRFQRLRNGMDCVKTDIPRKITTA